MQSCLLRLNKLALYCPEASPWQAVGAEAALKAGMHVYAILNGLNSKAGFDSLSVSGYVKNYEDLVNAAANKISWATFILH